MDDERRRVLKLLASAALLAETLEAQEGGALTPQVLEEAAKVFEGGLSAERLRSLLPAVQRNVDFFRIVRELEVDDAVEPAPIFHARRVEGER